MSQIRWETLKMPAAALGRESPLPAMDICLPYSLQDVYNRERTDRHFRTAVLENDILRATFLTEMGGRLWSLFHKKAGRELLYVNPVFQPANLAIRNAWFSGGVEWNMGTRGHSVFTCSPLFATVLKLNDNTPVLRMYEFDRIRAAPYQIDAFLPDGSEFLFIRPKIINPNEQDIPMYWWSNMAVPEEEQGRVLVPAGKAYKYGYKGALSLIPIPVHNGIDLSYPFNYSRSNDCFYCIPPEQQPWIAAFDAEGRGLIQTSTKRLIGRKLFVWGMQKGGRHWQDFLSDGNHPYIEIQAGLAQTQSEYITMPAKTEWSWLEAYGMIEADKEIIHGDNWIRAWRHTDGILKQSMDKDKIESIYRETRGMAEEKPGEIIQRGSGWGALEVHRRAAEGEKPLCSHSMIFDDMSLSEEQKPWMELLETGLMRLPEEGKEGLQGWMVQAQWRNMLEKAVKEKSDNWLAWLHLGLMHYNCEDFENAQRAWEKSLSMKKTPWVYRNLALAAKKRNHTDKSVEMILEASRIGGNIYGIALECCNMLLEVNMTDNLLEFIEGLDPAIKNTGRMKIFQAMAALKKGDISKTEEILSSRPCVVDVREGEISLSNLWFETKQQYISLQEGIAIDDALRERVRREFPAPEWLDFRQSL